MELFVLESKIIATLLCMCICVCIIHVTQGVSGLGKEELREAFLTSAEHGVLDLLREIHTLCGDDIINCVDSDLYTPLHRACYNGHTEVGKTVT